MAEQQDETFKSLKQAFDKFDKNNDQVISPEELREVLKSLNIPVSDSQMTNMINQVDTGKGNQESKL